MLRIVSPRLTADERPSVGAVVRLRVDPEVTGVVVDDTFEPDRMRVRWDAPIALPIASPRKQAAIRSTVLGIALGLLGTSVLAQAPENSADQVLQYCRAWLNHQTGPDTDAFTRGTCVGTIEGIHFVMGFYPPEYTFSRCDPVNGVVTIEQVVRVVVSYIEQRPQRMHESFKMLAVEAISKAWPCKR